MNVRSDTLGGMNVRSPLLLYILYHNYYLLTELHPQNIFSLELHSQNIFSLYTYTLGRGSASGPSRRSLGLNHAHRFREIYNEEYERGWSKRRTTSGAHLTF